MSIRATATVEEQERFGSCFACGMANDAGLKLDFEAVGDNSVTAYTFRKNSTRVGRASCTAASSPHCLMRPLPTLLMLAANTPPRPG